jgi:hypothetical protein
MRARPAALLSTLILAGCGLVSIGGGPQDLGPVPVGPLGPVIDAPVGGPPIECRGILLDRCTEVGTLHEDGSMGVDVDEVERVIVSCIGRCTLVDGEFRIDVVIDNFTREIARGGYGSSESQ